MAKRKFNVPYYLVIGLTVIIAGWGSVRHSSNIPWERAPEMAIFAVLIIIFSTRSVEIGTRMIYSIGTSLIFPVVYVYGIGAGVLISVISGIIDTIVAKKSLDRALFNVAQLSLCAIVSGLTFQLIGGELGTITLGYDIFRMLISGIAYTVVNVFLVSLARKTWMGGSIRTSIKSLGLMGWINNFMSVYIGIIYVLFIAYLEEWGILLFGLLLFLFQEQHYIGFQVSVEQNRRRELEAELVVDSKTKVLNFRFLNEWLREPLTHKVAVLFVDIDDFKVFNDIYGHQEGDNALISLARAITDSTRADDYVVRYGGEEFVVILPHMDRRGAIKVAGRIQRNLDKVTREEWKLPLTVSIGIAICPDDTQDKYKLIQLADEAMYQAKSSGKNRFYEWNSKAAMN